MSTLAFELVVQRGAFRLSLGTSIDNGGVTALFGPSGAGKTTLLRTLAGLERADTGHIRFGDEIWFDSESRRSLPTHRRGVGYVFQEPRLFPHLSVRDNLLFGYGRGRAPILGEVAGYLGLCALLDRDVSTLSGGEARRVALGRALLSGPKLLLLDEPLSGLDQAARSEILPYLRGLRGRFALPVLYVSHQLDEIGQLADRIMVLSGGRLAAVGRPTDVDVALALSRQSLEQTGVILDANLIERRVAPGLSAVEVDGQKLLVSQPEFTAMSGIRLRVLARDVSLALDPPGRTSILNILRGHVTALRPQGPAQVLVTVALARQQLLALITRHSADNLALAPGLAVYAQVKSVALLA